MKSVRCLRVSGFLFLAVALQACSGSGGPSEAEQQIISSSAFVNGGSPIDQVGGVHSTQDSVPATNPYYANTLTESLTVPLRDCSLPGLFEAEKQMVLSEAAADQTGLTIPVKFSYSFGKKHDIMAKYANERAVLSQTNMGTSYIPVGGKASSTHNGKHFYYVADNTRAADQYKNGERCFFSTVKINNASGVSKVAGGLGDKYDFINVKPSDISHVSGLPSHYTTDKQRMDYITHMIHYMYFGYCAVGRCAAGQAFAGDYANRLFKETPSLDEDGNAQIIKLYMGDFRSKQMQHNIIRLSEDTTRGVELNLSINNILNTCEIHKNYYSVTKNLSTSRTVNGYEFRPIRGTVQLLHNILSHDVDGTMLSSQYTPIVLDLDGDGVKTSSTKWGTYFNMANLSAAPGGDNSYNALAHRTAWVGGDYIDYNTGANQDNRVNIDVRSQAKDGFLVLPDSNGKVTSSAQMFGDNMSVAGLTYANGFLALKALAGKDCTQLTDPKSLYVGPWDEDLYENKLKVWVDEDRDGETDNGELKSLRELGILAINACHIVHTEDTDAFGNGTALRSAFLMQGPNEDLVDKESEILQRLYTGYGFEGEQTYFRLAIDLIFQVEEDRRCRQSDGN